MKILSEIKTKLNKHDNIEKHLAHVDDEIKELKEFFTFVNDTTDEIKVVRIEACNADLQRELVEMK